MASGRDDFIIAIRSAFLKKSTQQKFSLLTLVFLSTFVILLSSLDFTAIRYIKIGINEIVYRSSFLVSIPENFLKNTFFDFKEYTGYYDNYKKDKDELNILRSKTLSNEIIQYENKELKELINDYVSTSDKILAKIIVDHKSPFLRSIIINKGSKDAIQIGTNIYDQSYLVGRVIEVNFKTARVLLLPDLNSNVPVTIAPQNIQAIITGKGDGYGIIKYIKNGYLEELTENNMVYTSGTGAIFRSGIPVGKLKIFKNETTTELNVEFYSDFSQLKYVFAEVTNNAQTQDLIEDNKQNKKTNPIDAKLQILENEKKIIEDTNIRFKDENENLKSEITNLNKKILNFENKISSQKEKINQIDIDENELKFLRLNLEYSHKCRKSFFNGKGYKVGTKKYINCVLNKGNKTND